MVWDEIGVIWYEKSFILVLPYLFPNKQTHIHIQIRIQANTTYFEYDLGTEKNLFNIGYVQLRFWF